jgi:DNA repair photolyase
MNYSDLRTIVKDIIPRRSILESLQKIKGLVKEKGRKTNYQEFKLDTGKFELIQRLLNEEEMNSFLEVSLRAAHCPLPLNCDVYDSLTCSFNCLYCFANSFRASLYTSFFDNGKTMGLRYCSPDYYKRELDKLMKFRGKSLSSNNEVQNAIGLQIPIRLGIRYEDFLPIEGRKKVSLELLKYLSNIEYSVMINTKSSLIGREDYVNALADNKGGSAVHITMISSNDILLKKLEPGAPIFKERIKAAKALTDAGIRVVARIEPMMIFINDQFNDMYEWIGAIIDAGVRHITLDTYSWSATAPGVQRQMEMEGIDFERMFLLMSDAQWLGSLILEKFIEELKFLAWTYSEGEVDNLSCSTFDFGNVPKNSQDICCEVGDLFESKGAGFNWGNNLMAIRFIQRSEVPVTWNDYDSWVESKGGWLSKGLRNEVFLSWNLVGNQAYFPDWAPGIEPWGYDQNGGRVWFYKEGTDFRMEMLERLIK